MKVRLHKSFLNLPPSEKEIISREMAAEVQKQVNKEEAQLQKIWLQFACIVLHRSFGFGKNRLLLFLGAWREMYRINNKLKSEADQSAYLKAEIDKIFGEGGYPYKYIDKLEEMQ